MIYNRLIVAAIGFIRLEPYDGKLSRTVLRGGKDSNALLLPDPEYVGKPLAVGGDSGSEAWNCIDGELYCEEKRSVKTGMALWQAKKKAGLPGFDICASEDGFIFEIFLNVARNIFGIYESS